MNRPVRLGKQEHNNVSPFDLLCGRIEAFLLRHASFFLIIAVIVLMALFIALCFALCGSGATESGVVYNHLEEVI